MTCERVAFWCLTSVELTKRDANQWIVCVSINKVNIGVDIGAAAIVVANVLWSHVGNIAKCSCSEINYSNLNWKSILYAQSILRLISRVSGVVQNVVDWARALNTQWHALILANQLTKEVNNWSRHTWRWSVDGGADRFWMWRNNGMRRGCVGRSSLAAFDK